MDIMVTSIEGCLILVPSKQSDERGTFVKTFHKPTFDEMGLVTSYREEYYSTSRKNVLRGLHFQSPPYDHIKVVYCIRGSVLDAVLDLRVDSPSYGHYETFELDDEECRMVYIPPGLAHGFYTLSDSAIMVYKVTTAHHPEYDHGVRWDSAGIPWPTDAPIVSQRDSKFPKFHEYTSPFRLSGVENRP